MTNFELSDEDCTNFVITWKTSIMKSMRYYHGLYLETNIILLTAVFEIFRVESINYFKLDPGHYLSSHGYNWDANLRFTGVDLKLMSDIEKHQFIESMINRDISMICKR